MANPDSKAAAHIVHRYRPAPAHFVSSPHPPAWPACRSKLSRLLRWSLFPHMAQVPAAPNPPAQDVESASPPSCTPPMPPAPVSHQTYPAPPRVIATSHSCPPAYLG